VYYKILLVKFYSTPMFECTVNESIEYLLNRSTLMQTPVVVLSVLPSTAKVCPPLL
jgi:hypothetical protein